MLAQIRPIRLLGASVAIVAAGAMLAGCAKPESPEARVRAVIAAGELAAEAGDLSGILEHVSPAFRDAQGGDRDELRRYLGGYLLTHRSVHLVTRIDSVEFPYRDLARVHLAVGSVGREAAAEGALALAADVNDVVLELALEDDGWRVVRAEWDSTRRR